MTAARPPEKNPETVAGVVASIVVRDAAAAIEFYKRAFGAEELARESLDGTRVIHGHVRINGGDLFLNDPLPEHGQPLQTPQGFRLHLQVDSADRWFARAVAAGAEVVMPVELMFWGDRYGQVRDPFGVLWALGGPAQ